MTDPTPLDKLRSEYARQIVETVVESPSKEDAIAAIDHLLLEWGSKAYYQGRDHMAERIKKCADEWRVATS